MTENRWKKQEFFTLHEKGSGWVINIANFGSYIECFVRGKDYCIELNFFDGDREPSWIQAASVALDVAYRWQMYGGDMKEAVQQWSLSTL